VLENFICTPLHHKFDPFALIAENEKKNFGVAGKNNQFGVPIPVRCSVSLSQDMATAACLKNERLQVATFGVNHRFPSILKHMKFRVISNKYSFSMECEHHQKLKLPMISCYFQKIEEIHGLF